MERLRRRIGIGVGALAAAALAVGCGGGGSSDGDAADAADGDAAEVDAPVEADSATDGDIEPDATAEADGDAGGDEGDAADDGGPTGLPVGSPCTTGDECLDGVAAGECIRALVGLTFPDGYCSALGCTSDADCPGGAADAGCLSFGGLGWCADRCEPAAPDCREGYVCVDPDPLGPVPAVCLPVCRGDGDCPEGQGCDVEGDPPICRATAGARNGEACAASSDCVAGSACVAEDSSFVGVWPASGPPGGVCIQSCLADADCTNGGTCVLRCDDDNRAEGADDCDDDGTPGLDDDATGICLEACHPADPSACSRTGYSCRAVGENPTGPVDVCSTDCSEGGCTTPGWDCDPSAGFGSLEYGAGRCQPPFEAANLGAACAFTSGCTGGTCLAEAVAGAPGGICVEECRSGAGGDPCPTGSICLAMPGEIGFCMRRCTPGGTDCRDGWACERVAIFDICQPDCTRNDQCDSDCCSSDGSGICDHTRTSCL